MTTSLPSMTETLPSMTTTLPSRLQFYHRRLQLYHLDYNFTIYEVGSKDGWCCLAHEGVTIVEGHVRSPRICIAISVVWMRKGIDRWSRVLLSVGQNNNSVFPEMMQHFIQSAKSIHPIIPFCFLQVPIMDNLRVILRTVLSREPRSASEKS